MRTKNLKIMNGLKSYKKKIKMLKKLQNVQIEIHEAYMFFCDKAENDNYQITDDFRKDLHKMADLLGDTSCQIDDYIYDQTK